ncbi:MAG: RnfABCDGE type electron transport complex subunit B [Candidatus Omnitrophota bacterium]|nr:RnfABCDGE type electron transport complex subunit B [Candidatus Omnitrophota bacterium]
MKELISSSIVLGAAGFSFAALLAFLSRKLKVEEDTRVSEVLRIVSGTNCGACGFAGCRGFAEAVVKEGKIFSGCIPGGAEINEKIIKSLGLGGEYTNRTRVAVCQCGARAGEKKISSRYNGPATCKAAEISSGALDCVYGCLALGDCVGVCPVGAITLSDQKITVKSALCIGCGKCVGACPRKLFTLVPVKKDFPVIFVACSNKEKVRNVKNVCSRGCIACGICVKVSHSPFALENNLSRIDYKKIEGPEALLEAIGKCPTKCILRSSE